jgi:hypothetical protein
MPTRKSKTFTPPLKPHRRARLSKDVLKFVSENQRLSGFSGRITKKIAMHEPDMNKIVASAKRFNAQIPSPQNRTPRPRISKFGRHPARSA